jgi:hypothetical protein
MKKQTKNLAKQVQDALLALPDAVLMETLTKWLDGIDELPLEWSDEFRYVLGYRVQSDETDKIYTSFEELALAEPEGSCSSWIIPDAQAQRTLLTNLSIEQFYHTVIALAGEALSHQAYEEKWGSPPSTISDGYDFMRCLAVQLLHQAQYKPEPGHIFIPQQTRGRRKPMKTAKAGAIKLAPLLISP